MIKPVYDNEIKKILIKTIKLNKDIREAINYHYSEELNTNIGKLSPENYLFKSNKGDNEPINRKQAFAIIKKAGKFVDIDRLSPEVLKATNRYLKPKYKHDFKL